MISKKKKILLIVSSVLFVIFSISGGYLLWRVSQPETVAPEDAEAAATSTPEGGCECCCGLHCITDENVQDCKWYSYCIPQHGPCGCHGWGDPYPCSQYGKCGTRNGGNYSWTQTAWPSGTFCERGTITPASPAFPSAGSTTTWKCVGAGASPTCSARRQAKPSYSVTYNGGGGTCNPTQRSNISHGGNSAAPSCTRTGHTLTGFTRTSGSGGTLNTSTGAVTNVTGTQTITATWRINRHTVRYRAGDNGRVDGTLEQTVDYNASTTQVTAIPDEGYLFAGWDDGGTSTSRNETNVRKDMTFTANFSLSCGNGICDPGENPQNCPVDCPAVCGDGFCTHDENALNCPEDCPAVCSDGFCTHDETNATCPEDCPANCGDGYCDPETENAANCPEDCPAVCGDGFCTHDETSETCPEDCGDAPSDTPIIVPTGATVPETGIFDDTKTAVISGIALVFLGVTWIWLGRGMYMTANFLGKIHRKTVIGIRDMKESIRLRRRTNKMRKDSKRKEKFEKKVGKRI